MNAPFVAARPAEPHSIAPPPEPSAFDGVLAVGVTGHRREHFDAEGLAQTATQVRAALQAVAVAFPQARLRLVTSLASGADSLATDAALELGWTVQAVLPAGRAQYAQDFEGGARPDFLARLDRASAVFELPAGAPLEGVDYERAGRIMLDQCDLLLAVWDGQPPRGRGGTGQMVAEAVARHIPVLHLPSSPPSDVDILWSGFDPHGLARSGLSTVARAPLGRLREIRLGGSGGDAPTFRTGGAPGPLAWVYPLFLAALGVRPLQAGDFRLRAPSSTEESAAAARGDDRGGFGEVLANIARPRFAAADAQATQMALLYRGGFVANFSLSAFAVLLALAGLMVSTGYKWLLTAGEVSVVCAILWLTYTGRRRRWHQRWIEQRHLAERLRCLMLSARLGSLSLGPELPGEPSSDAELRQTARRLGLPSLRVEASYLRRIAEDLAAMLDDQVGYNQGVARRMHLLDHRLHHLGTALFALGAATCVGVLLVEVGLQAGWLGWLDRLMPRVSLAATMLSAALPAIGAAIYGIRMQGDFNTVAGRAHGLAHALGAIRDALELNPGLTDDQLFDELQSCLRMSSERLSLELSDWRSAHSARPLILPG